MTNLERKNAGLIYNPADEEIMNLQRGTLRKMEEFNATTSDELERRQQLLKEMLGAVGENCYIEPPFHGNWGGKNLFFGNNVYANFNLTVVDDVEIIVGDNVMFAPNCTLTTANHPIDIELRRKAYQYAKKLLSAITFGWAVTLSCCRASPLAITRSLARAVSFRGAFLPTSSLWGFRAALSEKFPTLIKISSTAANALTTKI